MTQFLKIFVQNFADLLTVLHDQDEHASQYHSSEGVAAGKPASTDAGVPTLQRAKAHHASLNRGMHLGGAGAVRLK